jgi:hypothetical protein
MIGVNFQPGGGQDLQAQNQQRPSPGSGVQEAIKVLSLRLPKVVGAQAAAPMALLGGSGTGGSRIDSVVNQVLSRIMPTGQPQQTPTAQIPSGPSFSGDGQSSAPQMPSWPWNNEQQPQQAKPWSPPPGFNPRVLIGGPLPPKPGMPGGVDASAGFPIGMIDELPQGFTPNFNKIGQLLGGFTYPSGGQEQDSNYLI